jgi:hypothetical protein
VFESICVRRHRQASEPAPIDLGLLAEALLFYQRVRVIADSGTFGQLVASLGPELLTEYVTSGRLLLTYTPEVVGVISKNLGTGVIHGATVIASDRFELQHLAPTLFANHLDKEGRARRLARRCLSSIEELSLGTREVQPLVLETYGDSEYVRRGVQTIFREFMPEYPRIDAITFEVRAEGGELSVHSNIDLALANSIYHRRIPASHSTITDATLLAHLNVQDDLHLAARYSSELGTTRIKSQLIRLRLERSTTPLPGGQATRFQEVVLEGGRAIAEAINEGRRSFADLLRLLERADRFRDWLKDRPPDADLALAYFREVTKESWVDTLPARAARWLVFTLAGAALDGSYGMGAGMALGAADAFLLDHLLKGWKPSQFVQSELRSFVAK